MSQNASRLRFLVYVLSNHLSNLTRKHDEQRPVEHEADPHRLVGASGGGAAARTTSAGHGVCVSDSGRSGENERRKKEERWTTEIFLQRIHVRRKGRRRKLGLSVGRRAATDGHRNHDDAAHGAAREGSESTSTQLELASRVSTRWRIRKGGTRETPEGARR